MSRLEVRKTYKLFIGGSFPRSESGRTYVATDTRGYLLANASRASRKDARDAVSAARKAFPGWSSRTPYNRGQVLYRVAEMLEGRSSQFVAAVQCSEGATKAEAVRIVAESVDRWAWYAGWTDKLAQVAGNANGVSSAHFNLSTPEPTGVVAVAAPQRSSLLGLVCVIAPAIVSGNTSVVVSSFERPLPAILLSEVLASSDVPGGVVNVLTGDVAEVGPWLASHLDVNAFDLTGVEDTDLARDLEMAGASNLKRITRSGQDDWYAEPGLTRMLPFLETKTVWHPIGL